MRTWVALFAPFTTDALLLEACLLFLVASLYAAFWVLRKRRYGSTSAQLPSGPVRAYLNELIAQTEQLRTQLFGLASHSPPSSLEPLKAFEPTDPFETSNPNATGPLPLIPPAAPIVQGLLPVSNHAASSTPMVQAPPAPLPGAVPPGASLGQPPPPAITTGTPLPQVNDTQAVTPGTRTSPATSSSAETPGKTTQTGRIEAPIPAAEQIRELEEKLADYDGLAEDLSNLKKIQDENLRLKSQLEKVTPKPDVPTGTSLTQEGGQATVAAVPPPAQSPSQVQPAIQTQAPSQMQATTTPPQSNSDLVAEFEKMLKG